MSLTVLSDANVNEILSNLAPSDVSGLINALEHALKQYSCGNEEQYQPERAVIKRPTDQISLFMPASTEELIGVKVVGIRPSSASTKSQDQTVPGLKSVLTLCDATGQAIGFLNAAALTAFRTSLGSMLLYRFRRNTSKITVFGAGQQALWHIRLAILLRGADIRSVTIINRSQERARHLIDTLRASQDMPWPSHISLDVFKDGGDESCSLEALVVESDAIFCTTPSTEALFPASYLTSEKALSKTRYISAIGSYRLDMQEIDPQLLQQVVDPAGVFSTSGPKNKYVVVDTESGCAHEAGELVKAGIIPDKVIEVGKLLDNKTQQSPPADFMAWLQDGFVIYKSVGTGVMDLAVGHQLLKMAESRNLGSVVSNF